MFGIGSKGGKKDLKQMIKNAKRKKRKELKELEIVNTKRKNNDIEKKNQQQFINFHRVNKKRLDDINDGKKKTEDKNEIINFEIKEKEILSKKTDIKNDLDVKAEDIKEDKVVAEKDNSLIIDVPTPKKKLNDNANNIKQEVKNDEIQKQDTKDEQTKQEYVAPSIKGKNKQNTELDDKKKEKINYLEKEIIRILNNDIDENIYQLKKIDSEIYTIQKKIDDPEIDKDDLEEIEKELDEIKDKFEQLHNQLLSLEKTFDLDFPVTEPDNYLIYLIDEYKDRIKDKKALSDRFKENVDYDTILNKIVELEQKKDELVDRVKEKESTLDITNEEIEKLNNDVINIEDMKKRIDKMLAKQNELLAEVKIKVDEAVHITDRVDYISKTVKHSILDLFILMNILKHNLSIKNNVVAAVSAKVALDLIIKMTTPTTERVLTKVSDVKDYNNLINDCLNDTEKLDKLMNENLDSISSIRYTFENDYKEYTHLSSYVEAIEKIINLENELKERKKEVNKIKKETELQLEKNNAKVKKYGSMPAA